LYSEFERKSEDKENDDDDGKKGEKNNPTIFSKKPEQKFGLFYFSFLLPLLTFLTSYDYH